MRLNDAIQDEVERVGNLLRGIFAGNIFDLGSAQVHQALSCGAWNLSTNNVHYLLSFHPTTETCFRK